MVVFNRVSLISHSPHQASRMPYDARICCAGSHRLSHPLDFRAGDNIPNAIQLHFRLGVVLSFGILPEWMSFQHWKTIGRSWLISRCSLRHDLAFRWVHHELPSGHLADCYWTWSCWIGKSSNSLGHFQQTTLKLPEPRGSYRLTLRTSDFRTVPILWKDQVKSDICWTWGSMPPVSWWLLWVLRAGRFGVSDTSRAMPGCLWLELQFDVAAVMKVDWKMFGRIV